MRIRLAARLLAGALYCLSAVAGAAPFGVQVGPDRLVLDTPIGFSDSAGFGSPRLTEFAETLGDAGNRVLVFALSDADIRRFAAGDSIDLRRYLIAVTPRARERERTSAAEFSALLAEAERNFGRPPPADTDYRIYMKGLPPGQAHLLAQLRKDSQVLSLLQGTMIPQPAKNIWTSDKPPIFKLSTTALVLIGGKPLYVSAFTAYESPADVEWITAITDRWVEDLRRLNK